jgi:hypothetical protein
MSRFTGFLCKVAFFLHLLFQTAETGQEISPNRVFHVIEYPSNTGIFLNPSLIAEEKGQTAEGGIIWPLSGTGRRPYAVVCTHILNNAYIGASFFKAGGSLDGNAPDYVNNYYSLAGGYKIELPLSFLQYISGGATFNISQQNLFDLIAENYFSIDIGLNAQILSMMAWKVKSGTAFQNLLSNKLKQTGKYQFRRFYDWSFYVSALNELLYFSGTYNYLGEEMTYQSGLIPRWGGIFKTAVYGVRPFGIADLSIKYQGDDALWLGISGIVPLSRFLTNTKDLIIRFDFSHDKINKNNPRRGFSCILSVKAGFILL